MEIRFAGGVAERPVGEDAVIVLGHRRKREREPPAGVQRREAIEAYHGIELQPACDAANGDLRSQLRGVRFARPRPVIAVERIRRLLAGR